MLRGMACWLAWVALAPQLVGQFTAFDWELRQQSVGGGAAQATVAGESVTLVAPWDLIALDTQAWVETTAEVDGHVSFTAQFAGPWGGPLTGPVAVIDGSFVLPPGSSIPPGAYAFAFDVLAGQGFGFGVSWGLPDPDRPTVTVDDLLFEPRTWIVTGGALDPRPWRDVAPPDGAAGFGAALANVGDLDGDGVPDLLVGAPPAGRVFVIGGASGAVLLDLAVPPAERLALSGAGDFDGDGVPDFAVGLPLAGVQQAGCVEVRSGAGGGLLAAMDGVAPQVRFGESLAAAGDVDGDGFDDVVACAPGDPAVLDDAHLRLLAGPDGQLLGHQPVEDGTATVTGLPDADGDGLPDVALAWTWNESSRLEVRSGLTGLSIAGRWGPYAERFALVPLPGQPELLWGVPAYAIPVPFEGPHAGHVFACDGATAGLLHEWQGSGAWSCLGDVVAAGDWDADGTPDVASVASVADGSGYQVSRRVRLFSGAHGGLLHELRASAADDFGRALAAAGDLDGDGAEDLAIGAPGAGLGLRLVHALDGLGEPRLRGAGELLPDAWFELRLDRARPAAPVWLVAGAQRLDLPLKGGLLVPSLDIVVPLAADAQGQVQLGARWPAGLPGPFTLWLQAWIADDDGPQGFTASNGLGGMQG